MSAPFWFVRNFDHDTGAPCWELWEERPQHFQAPKIHAIMFNQDIAEMICNLLNQKEKVHA